MLGLTAVVTWLAQFYLRLTGNILIQEDRDARFFLSDVNKVPRNCKKAITREGNMYFPDPNYKTYSGRVQRTARYLQASVEDAIRLNLKYYYYF